MRPWLVVPTGASLNVVRTSDLSVRATVDVPLGAPYALAEDGSELAWADGARVTVVGGLREGAPRVDCVLEAPAKVDALALREDVVFLGGVGTDDSSFQLGLPPELRGPRDPLFMADGAATEQRPLLGLIDRTAEVFMAMRLPFELEKTGKRITSIAFRGDTLVVVDEHVDPKEILTYDIRALRAPQLVRYQWFPRARAHAAVQSHVTGVADDGVTLAIVEELRDGRYVMLVRLHDLRFCGGVQVASAASRKARRPKVSGTYAVPLLARGVAIEGATLFLAGHESGLLVVDLSPILEVRTYTFQGKVVSDWSSRDLGPDSVRCIPVAQGSVVDVVAVDANRVYAVVDRAGGYHLELLHIER